MKNLWAFMFKGILVFCMWVFNYLKTPEFFFQNQRVLSLPELLTVAPPLSLRKFKRSYLPHPNSNSSDSSGLVFFAPSVDRVLRPSGYWILSGPLINWKTYYQTWKRSKEDVQAEQRQIEELAENLCWDKKYEKGDMAIWKKKVNTKSCKRKFENVCQTGDADDVWCNLEDVLLEMDCILRPEGAVIIRDEVDVLNKVRKIIGGMRWDAKIMDHDDGPLVPEKMLVVVKQYWVGSHGNSTSNDE